MSRQAAATIERAPEVPRTEVNRSQREHLSVDEPVRELPPIVDRADLEGEAIVADPKLLADQQQIDNLAFNEEMLTIVLHKGREKYSPSHHDFFVNGQGIRLPVDTEVKVARKFVEVMARSQPMDVSTDHETRTNEGDPVNRIIRSLSSNYPFTVIHDPNPRGRVWLASVMRQG
jgi:hypothetical protein